MVSEKLSALKDEMLKAVEAASSLADLEAAEIRFLGRKGELTAVLRSLGDLPESERRELGRMANEVKMEGERRIAAARERLSASAASSVADSERVDEWDWYAFESLNMPPDHPARDEWETFFMDAPVHPKWGKMILTPHATSGTARILTQQAKNLHQTEGGIRAINISKTYRRQM